MPDTPVLGADGFPISNPNAAPAAAVDPATAAPVTVPVVNFLTDRPRSRTYDLSWPVEVDGVQYRQVALRRLTTGEISAFVDKVRSAPAGSAEARFPLFYTVDGAQLPDAVWDAMDPDDTDALAEAGNDFLPARFRTGRTPPASSPMPSDTTGSTSAVPAATP